MDEARSLRDAMKMTGFFSDPLAKADPLVAAAIADELVRQQDQIEMIASENIVSLAVMEAQGSVLTNKYAEAILGAAITVGVSMLMLLKPWPLTEQRSCSVVAM